MVVMPGRIHIASPFGGYPFASDLSATLGSLKRFFPEIFPAIRWRFASP
jgi:hypothetical protein